jgi:hypothetical protein
MKRLVLRTAIVLAASLAAGTASAQYRLRADAYFTGSDGSTGLLVLSGEARAPSWIDAETVVWGATGFDRAGDVLVASVRARDPGRHLELRLGRFMVMTGALRPLHLDGADVVVRAPWGTSVEAFGGIPVALAGDATDFDWAAGTRVAQRIGSYASVGVGYLQMRSTGVIAYNEVGVDASLTPVRWIDAAFAGAVDLETRDLSDARLSLGVRPVSALRIELYAARRDPSHLLPATSLFSALGDVPSERAGGSLLWRAAPRLDLYGEAACESLAGEIAAMAFFRATLRLDDRGDGALGVEVHRQSTTAVTDSAWTGVRGTARIPITRLIAASTELEIVRPDDPRGRGTVWPWGLVALRLKPEPGWEVAGAVEASASPQYTSELTALLRVSRTWGSR